MDKNNKHIKTSIFAITVTLCFILPIFSIFAGGKQEPRIEIITEKDTLGISRSKEIRFVDGDGKVAKKMSPDGSMVSKNRKYVLNHIKPQVKSPIERHDLLYYGLALYNDKGQEKWRKNVKTFFPPGFDPETMPSYGWGIADSTGYVYINYKDSLGANIIEVYDTTGNITSQIKHKYLLEEIQLSPDGLILVSETSNDNQEKCILLLETSTNNNKLLKSQGKNWSISANPLSNKKVLLIGYSGKNKIWKTVLLDNLINIEQAIN